METTKLQPKHRFHSRWTPIVALIFSLAVFGATILAARVQLRDRVREQIINRDGEVLHAVMLMKQLDERAGFPRDIQDPSDQLDLLLEASQLRGVIAVRLFSPEGGFVAAMPAAVADANLSAATVERIAGLKPSSQFHPAMPMDDVFLIEPGLERRRFPVLEVDVPLHPPGGGPLAGIAQFLIEGHSLAAEFAILDQNLMRQASIAFAVGGVLLIAVIGWAFRLLERRNAELKRANRELLLAAKSSALGAVAAHLVHGLKNPLSGLQHLVNARGGDANDDDWKQLAASARRMQTIVADAINVLREEEHLPEYEISLPELAESLAGKVTPLGCSRGVEVDLQTAGAAQLPGRTASLVRLILQNLLQNAIEATPSGKTVTLRLTASGGVLTADVEDQGGGIAPDLEADLFSGCRSTKEGGSGIGLAISRQLALHLGAVLDLKTNSSAGCCFSIVLPLKRAEEMTPRFSAGN